MAVQVGQDAPDFTLKNSDMEDVTLSSFKGSKKRRVAVRTVGVFGRLNERIVLGE